MTAMRQPTTARSVTMPRVHAETFIATRVVRFHHCDPAGIVFYPQYFVMFNEVVKDFFTIGLGTNFADRIRRDRISVPMVHVDCNFTSASHHGDQLKFALNVVRVGTSSFTLRVEVTCGRDLRAKAHLTLVQSSLDQFRSVPLSPALRTSLKRFEVQTTPFDALRPASGAQHHYAGGSQ
jgi:4-hydroxybenzoyl-CoA thioesterase